MDILKLSKQLSLWAPALLPDSSFQALDISPIAPYLPAINWIIPVSFTIVIMETWLVAIAAYCVISAALCWARAIS